VVDTPYAFVVEGAAIERFVQMTNWRGGSLLAHGVPVYAYTLAASSFLA